MYMYMYMCYNLRVHSLRDAPLARKFPTSSFQLQDFNFNFQLQVSNFKFPTSSFQLQFPTSSFQPQVFKFSSFRALKFPTPVEFSKHNINKHPQNNLATLIFPNPNTQINIQHTMSLKLFFRETHTQNNLTIFRSSSFC